MWIRRLARRLAFIASAAIAWAGGAGDARGGVEDWEINEVLTSSGGDSAVRYIELRNLPGGCFFPSSRIVSYDADGIEVGSVAPVTGTTCFAPNTYYLLATTGAVTEFSTTADKMIVPGLPLAAGQVCFVSSTTRYDCVRWGSINNAIVDFFGATDTSEALAPPDGQALSRVSATHVVSVDWDILSPTPRGPNDGTPWEPPDAGPTPDAGAPADASQLPDAMPRPDAWLLPDAKPRADATDQSFLDLDPVGGASCGCAGGAGDGNAPAVVAIALAALACMRRHGR